jgi:Ca2+-binding EF-hand superfamily protein
MTKLSSRIYCAEQIEVPPDLPTIIKSFTKECIRYNAQQPDIVNFAKDYFAAAVAGDLESFLGQCEAAALEAKDLPVPPLEAEASAPEAESPVLQQSENALKMLKSVFNILDKDLDDSLTLAELKAGIEGTSLEAAWSGVFDVVVGDERKVDFDEFASFFAPIPESQLEGVRSMWLSNHFSQTSTDLVIETLTELFKKWDIDSSGAISIQELVVAVKDGPLPDDSIMQILRSDVNGDGSITLDEFLAYMAEGLNDEDMPEVREIFGL